jgi:hypothetical protein
MVVISNELPWQLRSSSRNQFSDVIAITSTRTSRTTAPQQGISLEQHHLLRNVVGKIATQQPPITTTPAVQRRSSGSVEIMTEGVGRNSADIHRTKCFPFSRNFKMKDIEVFQNTDQNTHPVIHPCFLFDPNPVRNNEKRNYSSSGT